MFGLFSKKAKEVKKEIVKLEKRDLMQGIVNGSLLIAFADGELEDSELTKITQIIEALPELSHFGSEIGKTIDTVVATMKAGFTIGKLKAMNEIRDLEASDDEKMLCFAVMIEVAQADGEVEEAELKILKEVGQALGVRLSDFGIE